MKDGIPIALLIKKTNDDDHGFLIINDVEDKEIIHNNKSDAP